jgi:hypothetical protein
MSPASAGPGAHETESRSRWTLRQLGSVVHQQVAGSKATAEPNNFDFGILFALLVNTKAAFTGKSGPYSGNVAAHRHFQIASSAPDGFCCPPSKLDVSQTLIEAEYGWLTANKPSVG